MGSGSQNGTNFNLSQTTASPEEVSPEAKKVKVRVHRLGREALVAALRHTEELRGAAVAMSAPTIVRIGAHVANSNPDKQLSETNSTDVEPDPNVPRIYLSPSPDRVPDNADVNQMPDSPDSTAPEDNPADSEMDGKNPDKSEEDNDEDRLQKEYDESKQREAEHQKEMEELLEKSKQREADHQSELDSKMKEMEELLEKSRQLEAELEQQVVDRMAKLGMPSLVGINANFTHDRESLARDFAERDLNEEVSNTKNFIKRIWKGNLAKNYYQAKYKREYLEGERTIQVEDKDMSLDDIIEGRGSAAIDRFVLGITKKYGEQFIHENAGEKKEEDKETTELVRPFIEKYAKELLNSGADLSSIKTNKDAKRKFNNELQKLLAEHRDDGKPINELLVNNYFEVAVQASELAIHSEYIEKVMDGFKVYNAEVRDSIRTEAHRNNVDRIVDKISRSGLSFIPPEILAAAVGSLGAFGKFGASTLARTIFPVGGIAVSAAFAGARERKRLTEDRTRMMRDAAMGLEYSGMSEKEPKSKQSKYEAELYGTKYDLRSAKDLTAKINQAVEGGDSDEILRAIAEARVRIDYSDTEQKDLIAYSSADRIGDERLRLDIALIEAEHSLSDEGKERLAAIKELTRKRIVSGASTETGERIAGVEDADRSFNRMRAAMAMKKAGKTAAIGALTFFASQEIIATLSPDKVSLLEKLGIIKNRNNDDASETLLTRAFTKPAKPLEVSNVSADNQEAIENLKNNGYRIDESRTTGEYTTHETRSDVIEVRPSESANQVKMAIDGYANNGTRASDGNELRAYLVDGKMVSGMYGNSTLPNGEVLNYDELLAADRIKACVNVDGADFILEGKLNDAGQMTWMEGGLATTTTGETMQLVGANGEKFYNSFMIFVDNDVDSDGVQHAIALATDPAGGTFGGTLQQAISYDIPIDHPAIYTFIKEPSSEVFTGGIVPPVVTSRVGLGSVRQRTESSSPETATTNPEPSPAPETGTEPNPGPASPETPPEAAPNAPENNGFTNSIQATFGSLVNEDGVRYMSGNLRDSIDEIERLNWWNGLDDDLKSRIVDFFQTSDNPQAQPFRQWLRRMDEIPDES